MSKKIAVQKELYDIRSNLTNLGFEISDMGEGENVEAIVYMGDGHNIPYNNEVISMTDGDNLDDNQSAILINANGKSIEEIKNIINNRVYSPLFDR